MFGELDDSNIYESFDAFSDGNDGNDGAQDFSFGDVNEQQGESPLNDDFLDMSSYGERMEQQQPQEPVPPQETAYAQNGYGAEYEMPQGGESSDFVPQDGQYDENSQGQYDEAVFEEQPVPQTRESKKGSSGGVFFLLLLVLLAAAAGGLFYYKKVMAPSDVPSEQATGDYFYDQTQEQGAADPQAAGAQDPAKNEDAAKTSQSGDVATIDVDLTTPSDSTAQGSSPAPSQANPEKQNAVDKIAQSQQKPEKELTHQERAKLKEQQDQERKNQIGLASNRVTIPVVSGGRVDPFMPYGQRIAAASAPQFDLIAPPADVPTADPVVDEIVQTKISGIMYDAARPSAIINIGGTDQLVHKGDVVNGFSVLNITKNTVTLKYKTNIYQASVGQNVGDGINLNPVSNLSKSFGGAYSPEPKNVIRF